MAQSPIDNGDTTFTSFSNPNYGLEDRLNSNYSNQQYCDQNLYEDLDSALSNSRENDNDSTSDARISSAKNQRKKYAQLDLASMGLTGSLESPNSPSSPNDSGTSILHTPLNAETENRRQQSNQNGKSGPSHFLDFDGTYATISDFSFPDGDADFVEDNSRDVTDNGKDRGPSKSRGFLGYYSMLEAKAREVSSGLKTPIDDYDDTDQGETTPSSSVSSKPERFDDNTEINSPDSNDSGIQSDARSDDSGPAHIRAPSSDDLYAVVSKPKRNNNVEKLSLQPSPVEPQCEVSEDVEGEGEEEEGEGEGEEEDVEGEGEILPSGWEKHQDDEGAYYWHIKSGTIQREPPEPSTEPTNQKDTKRSISCTSDVSTGSSATSTASVPSTPTSVLSATEEHLHEFEGHALQYAAKSLQNLTSAVAANRPELSGQPEVVGGEKPIRFAVRSLGWVGIDEEDLTPERSSKAVNKCIVDLSLGRNDINDVVGRWGDGKELFMDLDTLSMRLMDPQDGTLLNSQPIHSIRVWGVGRDNGRDFAYVARDKSTRKHMCHVFRCDTPARQIANTLRDICKKIMMERSLVEQGRSLQRLSRPTDLPNLEKSGQTNGQKLTFQNLYNSTSFPTPMEEPKKVIRCHYLGMDEVNKATGMDTLNSAIEDLYNRIPPEKWIFANVAVAPSTITITEHSNPDNKIDECRVRFLSFMGIAMRNVKLCAFIMHTAQDQFFAHVFHCEPSAGPLCKTIEAACKLRYQKCLDAHPQTPDQLKKQQGKLGVLGATLKAGVKAGVQNMFGLLRGSRKQAEPIPQSDDDDDDDDEPDDV